MSIRPQAGETRLVAPSRLSPWAWRGLLALLTLAWFGAFALKPMAFFGLGVNHFGVWFLDAFAILASNDAAARGLDPYAPNPLDIFHRPHVYSGWWLYLHPLGLTRAHTIAVGWTLGLAFLLSVLAFLRPRSARELAWYLAVLLASPILLALDRANNDLVVFLLLAAVVPCLMSQRSQWRHCAIVPVALAAGLKFYPAIAGLVLLAGTDRREIRLRLLLTIGLFLGVAWSIAPDFARLGQLVPRAEGIMSFGAANLLEAVGLTGRPGTLAGLGLAGAIVIVFLRTRIFDGWKISDQYQSAWLSFVLGAALLAGCFLTGTNFAYRWIFALWLAPFLWHAPRDPLTPARVRRLAGVTGGLLIAVLWCDTVVSAFISRFMGRVPADDLVAWADRIFLIEQPLTWAFFGCLLGFLAHFARGRVQAIFARD